MRRVRLLRLLPEKREKETEVENSIVKRISLFRLFAPRIIGTQKAVQNFLQEIAKTRKFALFDI